MPTSTSSTTGRVSPTPHLIIGKRRDEQFTVQASLAKLKEHVPASYFTPSLGLVTDGKAVGEAIRIVGPDLVYVRFPDNESKHPVSFTIPRQFLIPVTCRILARQSSRDLTRHDSKPIPVTSPASPGQNGVTFGGVSPPAASVVTPSAANSKDHHQHVDLHQHLGSQGEPALCVVCGRWDESSGQKRKSGHKCRECVGQKSLDRLRREFQRLMETEANESDDAEIQTHW